MRPLVPLLSVWVLLLSGWSAAAQRSSDQGKWSGRASLTAGYGWSMPDEELALTDTLSRFRQTAEVVLRYERKKFFVSTRLSQMQERNHTDGTKIVFSGTNDLEELTRFDMITRHSKPRQKRYEARTDARWTPSGQASFSGYIGYVDGHNTGENTVGQVKVVADQLAFSLETVDVRQRMSLSGFRGNLIIPEHKLLLGGDDDVFRLDIPMDDGRLPAVQIDQDIRQLDAKPHHVRLGELPASCIFAQRNAFNIGPHKDKHGSVPVAAAKGRKARMAQIAQRAFPVQAGKQGGVVAFCHAKLSRFFF